MKRQWITAGVIGVCLVILGAIWFILGNPEETGEEDQKAETSVWKGKERIQEIRVENEQGGYILRWENDEAEAEGMEDLPFDTKLADGIRDDLENMKTEKKGDGWKRTIVRFWFDNSKGTGRSDRRERKKNLRFLSGMRYLIRKTRLDTSFGWIRYGRSKAAR